MMEPDASRVEIVEATQRIAKPRSSDRAKTESAFLFRVGSEWYGIATSACERVVDETRTHTVPHRRGGILLGLGSVAGDLLPVISLPALLGLDGADNTDVGRRTMLFVSKQTRYAVPVSEVYGVYRFHADERQPVPATLASATSYAVGMVAWDGHMVGILDARRLFDGIARGIA